MENATLSFRDAPATMLSVRSFRVEEAMSALFEIHIRAVSPLLSLDLPQLTGHPVSFELHGSSLRRWHGLCVAAEFIRASEDGGGLATYEFVLRPALWRLTQRVNNRLMQHLSIPAMVTRLLEEWGIAHEWRVAQDQYPKLELRTQFGETDFAFFSRLLEEAGISYWFADPGPDEAESRLVLGDTPVANEERAAGPIPFTDDSSLVRHGSYLTNVRVREVSMPGRVTLREYDYRRARVPMYAQADSPRLEERAHEQYIYAHGSFLAEGAPEAGAATPVADDLGVARHRSQHGQGVAQRRMEALEARRGEVTFDTGLNDLSPGTVLRIADHPRDDLSVDRTLLMTRFTLQGEIASTESWQLSGRAVWTSRPHRPAQVTPRPRIHGVLTAVVVGPNGKAGQLAPPPGGVGALSSTALDGAATAESLVDNEIHVDEHGRVRVQFPWDREHHFSGESSAWLRVSQGWAGAGYGMFTVPRVGHEVLVAFVDGDADSPLIVGRVHNVTEPVPFPLPANKTVSTWKTASSPGGDGSNELRFDDAAGREHVYLQAQKDMDQLVNNNHKQSVGRNWSRYTQANDHAAVGASRTQFVNMNDMQAVGLNQASFVGLNRSSNVGVEDSTFVGTRWSVTVARGMTRRLARELEGIATDLGSVMRSGASRVLGLIPGSPLSRAADAALSGFGSSLMEKLQGAMNVFDAFETEGGPPPTSIEVVDRQIKLSTGEASIVLDGPNVVITAQGAISFHAMDSVTILSEKEVAVASRGKAAVVSATDDVILQAHKDLHLNPYEGSGELRKVQRIEG